MKKTFFLFLALAINIACLHAQWQPTNGPSGGESITCMSTDGKVVVAGSHYGSIYLSDDQGKSWKNINSALSFTSEINSLFVRGDTVLAGTYEYGAYVTFDSGKNWMEANKGLSSKNIFSVAIKGNVFFAGTSSEGLFRSADFGRNWSQATNGLSGTKVFALAVEEENIYASTTGQNDFGGIFLSKDNGSSWEDITFGVPKGVRTIVTDEKHVYLGVPYKGVYCLGNNGKSWDLLGTELSSMEVLAIAVSGSVLYAGTGDLGIYISKNNGKFWDPVMGHPEKYITTMVVCGKRVIAGLYYDYGIFTSDDKGDSWIPSNSGFPSASVKSVVADGTNLYAVTENNGMYLSSDSGTTWSVINDGIKDFFMSEAVVIGKDVFVGNQNGVLKFDKSANTWTRVNESPFIVNTLITDGSNLYAGIKWGGVRYSGDMGKSWSVINDGFTNDNIQIMLIKEENIFAGTGGGGLYMKSLKDKTWKHVDGLNETYINSLACDLENIYAATINGIYISADNGTTWKKNPNELYLDNVWGLVCYDSTIYANVYKAYKGTNEGIYISTDKCQSWSKLDCGLKEITSITIMGKNAYASGIGVRKFSIQEMNDEKK